jgi:hypothetical protein
LIQYTLPGSLILEPPGQDITPTPSLIAEEKIPKITHIVLYTAGPAQRVDFHFVVIFNWAAIEKKTQKWRVAYVPSASPRKYPVLMTS